VLTATADVLKVISRSASSRRDGVASDEIDELPRPRRSLSGTFDRSWGLLAGNARIALV
jgi:hypothetical protein